MGKVFTLSDFFKWAVVALCLWGVFTYFRSHQSKKRFFIEPDQVQFCRTGIWFPFTDERNLRFSIQEESGDYAIQEALACSQGYLVPKAWQPHQSFQGMISLLRGKQVLGSQQFQLVAPPSPAVCTLSTIPLKELFSPTGGNLAASSILRFSPDGKQLAIGTRGGEFCVIDWWHLETIIHKNITDGEILSLSFSRDGKTLFVGERSSETSLYAFSIRGQRPLWRIRLSDEVKVGHPTGRTDPPAWTGIPRILLNRDGDLLVLIAQSSTTKSRRVGRACLFLIDAKTGDPVWRFPQSSAIEGAVPWFDASDDCERVAFISFPPVVSDTREQKTISPPVLFYINGQNGRLLWKRGIPYLCSSDNSVGRTTPVAISPDGTQIAGLGPGGRAFVVRASDVSEERDINKISWKKDFRGSGAPARPRSGHSMLAKTGREVVFCTQQVAKLKLADSSVSAPSAGKSFSSLLYMVSWDRHLPVWQWPVPLACHGICISDDQKVVLMNIEEGRHKGGARRGGFQLFDMTTSTRSRFFQEYWHPRTIDRDQLAISTDGRWVAFVDVQDESSGIRQTTPRTLFVVH